MPSHGRGSMKRVGHLLVAVVLFALASPGVVVTVRNAAGGPERTAQTQTDGSYLFTNLSVESSYEVQADLQGFATVVHSGVSLKEGQRVAVDFTLFAATAEALV